MPFNHQAGTALISLQVYNEPLCVNSSVLSFTAVPLYPFENYCSTSHLWLQDFRLAWLKGNELLNFSNVRDGIHGATQKPTHPWETGRAANLLLAVAHVCLVSVNQIGVRDELSHTQS